MDTADDDPRSPSTVKFDVLVDQVNTLTAAIEKLLSHDPPSQKQTVIHKTEGLGAWMGMLLGGAIVACFATWVGFVIDHQDRIASETKASARMDILEAYRNQQAAQISELKKAK